MISRLYREQYKKSPIASRYNLVQLTIDFALLHIVRVLSLLDLRSVSTRLFYARALADLLRSYRARYPRQYREIGEAVDNMQDYRKYVKPAYLQELIRELIPMPRDENECYNRLAIFCRNHHDQAQPPKASKQKARRYSQLLTSTEQAILRYTCPCKTPISLAAPGLLT